MIISHLWQNFHYYLYVFQINVNSFRKDSNFFRFIIERLPLSKIAHAVSNFLYYKKCEMCIIFLSILIA